MSSSVSISSHNNLSQLVWSGVLVETIVQILVSFLILFSWYLCTFQVGIDWLIRRHLSYRTGTIYLIAVNFLIPAVGALYLYLCSARQKHSVASFTLPDKSSLTEPYQCVTLDGDLELCSKGNCRNNWKPPRSYHCSTCGVCRLEFDHHCPWIGNCVTLARLKAFHVFLLLVPFAFFVCVLPVARTLCEHIKSALDVSRQDKWANEIWWNWFGSWIICAGPFGRWIVGTVIGYILIGNNRVRELPTPHGFLIEEPHLRVIITAGVAFLLSIFSIGLVLSSAYKVLQGVTTFESLRPPTNKSSRNGHRYDLVCIPHLGGDNTIASILPTERMYDLGTVYNWHRHLKSPIFPSTPSSYIWPKINPTIIHRIHSSPNAST